MSGERKRHTAAHVSSTSEDQTATNKKLRVSLATRQHKAQVLGRAIILRGSEWHGAAVARCSRGYGRMCSSACTEGARYPGQL